MKLRETFSKDFDLVFFSKVISYENTVHKLKKYRDELLSTHEHACMYNKDLEQAVFKKDLSST